MRFPANRKASEAQEAELQQIVKNGDVVVGLLKTKGWKIMEEQILLRIHGQGNLLKTSKDEKEMFRAQGAMQALESLYNHPKTLKEAADQARLELEGGETADEE